MHALLIRIEVPVGRDIPRHANLPFQISNMADKAIILIIRGHILSDSKIQSAMKSLRTHFCFARLFFRGKCLFKCLQVTLLANRMHFPCRTSSLGKKHCHPVSGSHKERNRITRQAHSSWPSLRAQRYKWKQPPVFHMQVCILCRFEVTSRVSGEL